MPHYNLIETRNTGKPARFSANGKRISREQWEHIHIMANMYGRLDCFITRAWPMPCGGTKRKNYSCAQW